MSNQEIVFQMTQELFMLERLANQTQAALRFAEAHKASQHSRDAMRGMFAELTQMIATLSVQLGFHAPDHNTGA